MNLQIPHPVPTPWPTLCAPLSPPQTRREGLPNRSLQLNSSAACEAYAVKRAEWATLTLRQTWADEAWMRTHLAAAGLRVVNSNEPATVARLRSLLRRVSIQGPAFEEANGTSTKGFLA